MSVKNDRWSALSLKDRADLMNMYITNGISDLKEMKKHYNSFGDGGDTEQTLSGKPTLEEFIQSKVDSTRNAALEKSYTRVKGIEIPYEFGEYEKNSVQRTLEYEEPYAAKFTYGPYTKNEEENIKTINYRLGRYYQAKKELEDNCKYGFNCIGTATDNYPKESRTDSNKDFEENFEKYGFQYVGMKNAKPGDIAKTPEHAMIYVGTDANGNLLFNYSDGGITEYNYKKDARYPAPYYGVYTYVGTPELIQQWTEEYNTNDSKKYGGKINSFSGEEDTNTSTKNELKKRLYDGVFPWSYKYPIVRTSLALLGHKTQPDEFRDDIWAEYLNIPQEERHNINSPKVVPSKYSPTIDKDSFTVYKTLSKIPQQYIDALVQQGNNLEYNQSKTSPVLEYYFGDHTISKGHDDKGSYVSYYDLWDVAPFFKKGDESMGVGNPISFYDRVYLDDYYDIPEAFRGNPYITPAVLTDTNAYVETD